MRRTTVWMVALSVTVTGCSQQDRQDGATSVDVQRARLVWEDPWAAPMASGMPDAGVTAIDRVVGSRWYQTREDPGRAVTVEVRAGEADGWTLVGARCSADHVVAWLSRGASVADGAVAVVDSAAAADPAATSWPAPAPGLAVTDGTVNDVTVEVSVASHEDRTWPQLEPLALSDSCLAAGPSSTIDWAWLAGPALGPDEATVPGGETVARSVESASDLDAVTRSVLDDPLLVALGIVVGRDSDAQVPIGVSETFTGGSGLLQQTVGTALDDGWTLTGTGCVEEGPMWAELHRRVDDDHDAAIRLVQVPVDAGSVALSAVARVSGTQWGARTGQGAVGSMCWDETDQGAFGSSGVPAFGPTDVDG